MNTTSKIDQDKNSLPRLRDLIKDIRFAMLTTKQTDGSLRSRPMTSQSGKSDEEESLWFFMSMKGEPVQDLQVHPQVNVAYADPGNDSYVSVSGRAMVVDDLAKKKELWSKMVEAWFPGGVSDPDLALVQVEINQAGYWEAKSSKMVQLAAMAKAAVTGKPPTDIGEHGEVQIR